METGSQRIRDIVLSLRTFSRLDEAAMKRVDLHDGIESVLLMVQYRLKATHAIPEIQVVKTYGTLPDIECYANQVNQVLLSVINNAIDALVDCAKCEGSREGPPSDWIPTIEISTEVTDAKFVRLRIADNGIGMSAEVAQKMFDPFFTTKPVGSGTGLGLAIAYQIIVEKHQGTLEGRSSPDGGAEFVIEIPIQA
jgi:signal transduction histidine kinase